MDLNDILNLLKEFKNDFKDFKKEIYGYFSKIDGCIFLCKEVNEMNTKQEERIIKLEKDLNNLANKEKNIEEKVKNHDAIFKKP